MVRIENKRELWFVVRTKASYTISVQQAQACEQFAIKVNNKRF